MTILFLLSACAAPSERDHLTLTQVDFADLPGWNADHQSEAIPALLRSCAHRKTPACAALKQVPAGNDAAARAYFEHWFCAYAAAGEDGSEGLFTGYYEASLHGSLKQTKRFNTPLFAKPSDLVTADLGTFNNEWKGRRLTGKVEKQKFVPYDSRGAIGDGKLNKRARALLWVDDPVDAFFLAVQGSGRVRMTDGSVVHVGYDDANGRTYVPIGRILGLMKKIDPPVTMEKIRAYLAQHPGDADEIMNLNASYVFFKVIKGPGPIGAEGVALTPKRSLAVDPSFVRLGTPLWLDSEDADGAPLQRLMIAQDTGGAIKGAVRGDFFWGYGTDAAAKAGAMQSRGHYYLLQPVGDAK
jgi:membrane-bound lytic murein transglycosylase A